MSKVHHRASRPGSLRATDPQDTQRFSTEEVAQHNTPASTWLIIDGGVYDVTSFASEHPGGKKIILASCGPSAPSPHTRSTLTRRRRHSAGTDSSEKFWKFHSASVLKKVAAPMKIGEVGEQSVEEVVEASEEVDEDDDGTYFGELVPFGDPYWCVSFTPEVGTSELTFS